MAGKDKRLEQILEGKRILQKMYKIDLKFAQFYSKYKDVWANAWYDSMWSVSVLEKYEPESKQKNKPCIVLYLAPIDGEDGQFHRPFAEVKAKLPEKYRGCRIFVEQKTSSEMHGMKRYMEELCKEPETQPTEGELRIARAEAYFRRSPATNDLLAFLGIQ